ncbi:hypothetical protein [Ensifer sesbaniae]|uniref:hypothetical protein n=1 Tax=Ensifer sesbaniae TaxID=1214071 RepID=UPI001FE4E0AA|nr:hypothetical protein [Ensifer sesbaniae]
MAEIISSGETIGDVVLGDVRFEGKAHLMKHDVVTIAVADERRIVSEHPGQGVEQPGVGELRIPINLSGAESGP